MYQQAKQYQVGVQISYYIANEWSYFHVRLHVLNQEIAIQHKAFKSILGIDYNVEVGCRDITVEQAIELGFIFPTRAVLKMV